MTRKPCDDDLFEIALFLDDVHPDSEVYPAAKRVARWLEQSSRGDLIAARRLGCSVAYYRQHLKPPVSAQ